MEKIIQRKDGAFFKKYDAGRPVWTRERKEAMRLSDTDSLMVSVLERQASIEFIDVT